MNKLILGTRGSKLARTQSALVRDLLLAQHPDLAIDLRIIVTEGDKLAGRIPSASSDKGLFTRAIESELLDRTIDFAVHSLKDLPTQLPAGLCIGAIPLRAPVEDVLVGPLATSLNALPPGARIGSGGIRRAAQMRRLRPDVSVIPVQGNVDTRLKKLDNKEFDAIILAAAGLARLGLQTRISSVLDSSQWYHAVGQGALAIEIRSDDEPVAAIIRTIDHALTRRHIEAERAFLQGLGGGCLVPVGVRGAVAAERISLCGMVCGFDGTPFLEDEVFDKPENAGAMGRLLADKLLSKGAAEVLSNVRNHHGI